MRVLLLLALLGCGCGAAPVPPGPVDAGCGEARLEMGTDVPDGGFAPISDGQDLTVVMGPQGGFHLFVSVQAHGLPRTGTLAWTLRSASGDLLGMRSLDLEYAFLSDLECGWERRQDALVFIDPSTVDQQRGRPAQLELRLGELTRSATVVPR